MGESERRCARGGLCVAREPERDDRQQPTGVWLPALIAEPRGLCAACTRVVVHALNHLAGDVVELTMLIGNTSAAEVHVGGSRDLPVPIRLGIEALRAEIDHELQLWAEPVAEALGVEWDTTKMGHSRFGPRVQRAAHLLVGAVDTLLGLPEQEQPAWWEGEPVWDDVLDVQDTVFRDGVDGALALVELHRRAYAAAGRTKYVTRLPQPCPWCSWATLVRHNGQDHVECENCRKVVPRPLLDWLVSTLLRERERQAVSS